MNHIFSVLRKITKIVFEYKNKMKIYIRMHGTKNTYRHFVKKKKPKGTPAKHKQQQNFREENMRIKKKF